MKRFKLLLFLVLTLFFTTSCSEFDYTSERLSAGIFNTSYAEIIKTDDETSVILYCVFTSGTYEPKLLSVAKNDDVITYTVEQYTKSKVVTCDMAYWKITVNVKLDYLEGINEAKVIVV